MSIPVGIDDLDLYGGTLAIESTEIAAARGFFPKDLQKVGFLRRSVMPTYEDPVTLAVNAARSIVEAAGPDAFELLILATETGLDYGKPISSYVHKYLGLGPRCRNFETKHACYAGTASLQMATAWVQSGMAAGKKALVISTDTTRPHFGELAELVPGSAAVALSVSAEPKLFELEPCHGYVSQEVYDVSRPSLTYEWIDPVLSLYSYLDLVEMAWKEYRNVVGPVALGEHFDYVIYHTPLVSLIKQAHGLLIEFDGQQAAEHEVDASFARMVEPALGYSRELGNTYSGSLYVALAGLLEMAAPGADTRVGCFSYGSGACAEFYSGLVREGAPERLANKRIGIRLEQRRRVSVREYEAALLAFERAIQARDFEPELGTPPGHYEQAYHGKGLLVLDRIDNYYRTYRWS